MGRDSGKCLHELDVLWVCGQPHTSGGGGWGATAAASVLNTTEMQRVYTCYTTEIINHCYTAKITLYSLVGDATLLCCRTMH